MAPPEPTLKRKNTIIAVSIAILLTGFILRFIFCDEINNNINDLSARQAMMCIDILNGIIHFPNGPWLLEFDEAGYAWMMVPWIKLIGKQWSSFRLFSVLLTSIVPLMLAWVSTRRFGLATGITAGLIMATMPAQLVWDRYPIMGSVAAITMTWLLAFHLADQTGNPNQKKNFLAGSVIAAGCYIGHYSLMITPAVGMVMIGRIDGWRKRCISLLVLCSGLVFGMMPLIYHNMGQSDYGLWRMRHFHDLHQPLPAVMKEIVANFFMHLLKLYPGTQECIFLRKDVPVIPLGLLIMILVSVPVLIRRREWNGFWFIWGLPATLYLMMGLIRAESWGGIYHSHAMPFFSVAAAIGLCWILKRVFRKLSSARLGWIHAILLIGIMVVNIHLFFSGSYAIHPRPDLLTRIQNDLRGRSAMPYLFSRSIQEVAHYNLPFWLSTRTFQHRVSIVDRTDRGWRTDPDRLPVHFFPSEIASAGFVIMPDDYEAFRQAIGEDQITGRETLESSKLLLVTCSVDVPELLQRTWTDSIIPPMLPIEHNP